MLKIKDNVDLKELEKFGFKQVIDSNGKPMNRMFTGTEAGTYIIVSRDEDDKGSEYYGHLGCADWERYNNLEVLYNLIKADLVEKVSIK